MGPLRDFVRQSEARGPYPSVSAKLIPDAFPNICGLAIDSPEVLVRHNLTTNLTAQFVPHGRPTHHDSRA